MTKCGHDVGCIRNFFSYSAYGQTHSHTDYISIVSASTLPPLSKECTKVYKLVKTIVGQLTDFIIIRQ